MSATAAWNRRRYNPSPSQEMRKLDLLLKKNLDNTQNECTLIE